MAKRGNGNGGSKVSAAAWNASLNSINNRFDKMELMINELSNQLSELSDKVNSKVSVKAWNKANADLISKFKSKVSVKAWEKSLVDMDKQFKDLALKELDEFDERLDKNMELINNLTTHLNEKVNLSAWNDLKDSNKDLTKKVNNLSNRFSSVERMLKQAKVTEDELKELLESI